MRRDLQIGVIVLFLALLTRGGRTFGAIPPLPQEEERAIIVLLDPHAGSNSKMSAVRVLMSGRIQARSLREDRIVAVLVRQAHYDMKPVRDLCKTALVDMIGFERTGRLIAAFDPSTYNPMIGDFLMDFRRATRGWKGRDDLADSLASEISSRRQGAIKEVVAFAEANPTHFPTLFKSQLLDDLDCFDRAEPSMRSSTLALVEQLVPPADAAVPILRRALADRDPRVRTAIERFYVKGENDPRYQAISAAIASGLIDSDSKIAAAAAKRVPAAPDDSLKTLIARAIAGAAADGNADSIALLKRYEIKPAVFAQAAAEALWKTTVRSRRIALFNSIREAGVESEIDDLPSLRGYLISTLVGGDDRLATAAAELLTTPKSRAEAEERLVMSIKEGTLIAASVVKTMKLKPESFSGKLIESIETGKAEVRRAAIEALLVTGIGGDAIHAALLPLIRNPDPEIRHGAATLLNTPEALARAKVPDLLEDMRSDAISIRQLGARQLDELGIEPEEITSALVLAVEGGDFAARVGLLAALEAANTASRNPIDVLRQTAAADNSDAGSRAYARAALREVDLRKPKSKVRP